MVTAMRSGSAAASTHRRAVLYLLAGAFAFSCFPIVTIVGSNQLVPFALAVTALSISGMCFTVLVLARPSARKVAVLALRDWRTMAYAFRAGVWVLISFAAFAEAVVGAAPAVGAGNDPVAGFGFGVIAALAMAMNVLVRQRVCERLSAGRDLNPLDVVLVSSLLSRAVPFVALVMAMAHVATFTATASISDIAALLVYEVVVSGLNNVLYLLGINLAASSTVGVVSYIGPVLSLLWLVVFGYVDQIPADVALGVVVIIATSLFAATQPAPPPQFAVDVDKRPRNGP